MNVKENNLSSFGLLAGGLAHDYNNMLTAMLGGIDLILCDDISDSVREAATDIKATMLKAAVLVKRMLSCATGAEAQPERLDLNTAAADIVRIMRRSIPENAVVNFTPAQGLPPIMADAAMLWQVIMNLVVNACDALGGGDGLVAISTRAFRASPAELAGFKSEAPLDAAVYAEVSVSDTGCGMTPETLEKIFDPLFTTKSNGNGLGLASVASAVALFRGGIKVESTPGKGTVFRIAFPALEEEAGDAAALPHDGDAATTESCPCAAAAAPEAAASPAAGAPAPAAPAAPATVTVLVVDDDASIVKLLKIILSKAKYNVVTASDGRSGLEAYRSNRGSVSICLIDASMGAGMDGLELCAAIRADDADIPLVLMSAYRAKEMSGRMAASGVTTFLAKPFRGGEVLGLCAKFTGARA